MPETDVNEPDAGRRVDELARVLNATVEIALDAPSQLEWAPRPGSLFATEQDGLRGEWLDAHQLAWTYIAMTAQAATDHLASLEAILSGRSALGLLVIARTVGEAAGQGWWFAEAGIGHEERVRRAYGIRARGLLESERLAEQFLEDASDRTREHLTDQLARISENRQRVLQQARDVLGFPVHRDGEKLIQLVNGPPTRTALFEDVLESASIGIGGIVYGAWSGVAHSNPVQLLDYHDQVDIDESSAGLQLQLLLSTIESAVYVAIEAHREMMTRVFLLSGWDCDAWADWIDEQKRVLRRG